MNFNWDILKKIPLFKNVDFEDKRSRMRVAMFFFGAALFLIVLVLMVIPPSDNKGQQKPDDTSFLEVPEGKDYEQDLLGSDDMLSARERLNPGNKDIFLESAPRYQNTYIAFNENMNEGQKEEVDVGEDNGARPKDTSYHDALAEKLGLPPTPKDENGNPREMTREERRSRANEIFGIAEQAAADKVTPETASQQASAARPSRREMEFEPEPEPDRLQQTKTASPAKGTSGKKPIKKTTPASATSADTYAETRRDMDREMQGEDDAAARQRFRKSGGISSVDDDWGTIEGLSSLDNDDMYIDDDIDHPYKVVFVRDQKLRSGDRVTLRLMEDLIVDNMLVPKNTHIYGVCSIGERLMVNVSSMEINGKFYTISMSAYDSDGAEGLYCPETVSQEAAQQTKQQAVSGASSILSSAASIAGTAFGSPYLGNAIGTLTNTGARLISQKGGTTTVEVRSGYTFYLLKNSQ